MLVELIAVYGVGEEVCEVVIEVELALHSVSIGEPSTFIIGFGQSRRERKSAGIAAIGRIKRIVQSKLARGDGAQRHLVSRVPFVAVGQTGHGQPVEI